MPRPDGTAPGVDPARLEAIAVAIGVALGEPQRQQLLAYLAMLQRWNATYNLTAVREPEQMLVQHIADCLAVVPALQRHCRAGNLRGHASPQPSPSLPGGRIRGEGGRDHLEPLSVLDVGSGGGLPGVVLAVACPQLTVTCVDTVGKKAAFVRQAGAELGLSNLKAEHGRAESLAQRFDIVTSRAFATLGDFCGLTRSRLSDGGVWMAMKGKLPHDEIATIARDVELFHVEQLTVPHLNAERCLVWMRPVA